MATVPVTNTAEVNVRALLNGINVENVLNFLFTGAIDSGDLLDLAVEIAAWWATNQLTYQAPEYVIKEVSARDLTLGSTASVVDTSQAGEAGTYSGQCSANNIAWVVKFLTAQAGRSYRGRNYFTGLSEAMISANEIGSSDAAAIVGNYEMLLGGGGVLPTGWTWVVVSRWEDLVQRASGLCTPITAVSFTDYRLDTQRKRMS